MVPDEFLSLDEGFRDDREELVGILEESSEIRGKFIEKMA